jgi:hypothetical protein
MGVHAVLMVPAGPTQCSSDHNENQEGRNVVAVCSS